MVTSMFPDRVACKNCGYVVGKINRETAEVVINSFRILRVMPYEFEQVCLNNETLHGHGHIYNTWSKIVDLVHKFRGGAVFNFYCKNRRLEGPCEYSPGPRALFFAGIQVSTGISDSEEVNEEILTVENVEVLDDIEKVINVGQEKSRRLIQLLRLWS